jgi:hypothetical protein
MIREVMPKSRRREPITLCSETSIWTSPLLTLITERLLINKINVKTDENISKIVS